MKLTGSTQQLVECILEANPSHKPFLDVSLGEMTPELLNELEHYLGYCASRDVSLAYIAESYNTIVQDTFLEQIYFMRNKRYRYSTYAEVAGSVYNDAEYMGKYMYGLAVTLFFWPAHRALKSFFERTLPGDRSGSYLEIGPGHGFYFMTAIAKTEFTNFVAIDISEKSVAMTRDVIESGYFGTYSNYSVQCKDFLSADVDGEVFDALVMGEVLEHVEDPGLFLRRIRSVTRADSYIYISTCMNAPAVDHLSLFTSAEELRGIVEDSGLRVADECLIPYPGLSVEETEAKQLAMNIGLVLAHS